MAHATPYNLELMLDTDAKRLDRRLAGAVAACANRRVSIIGKPDFAPLLEAVGIPEGTRVRLPPLLSGDDVPKGVSTGGYAYVVGWDPHIVVIQDVAASAEDGTSLTDWAIKLVTEGFLVVAGMVATDEDDAAHAFVETVARRYLLKDELLLSLVRVRTQDDDVSESFRDAVMAAMDAEVIEAE